MTSRCIARISKRQREREREKDRKRERERERAYTNLVQTRLDLQEPRSSNSGRCNVLLVYVVTKPLMTWCYACLEFIAGYEYAQDLKVGASFGARGSSGVEAKNEVSDPAWKTSACAKWKCAPRGLLAMHVHDVTFCTTLPWSRTSDLTGH